MINYREYPIYKELERLINEAGVEVIYQEVPDDAIDGAIWARTDSDSNRIMMPDDDAAFPDFDTACLILGHEMGHIISGVNSPDIPDVRVLNEATCDSIGVYLYRLAEMTADHKAESALMKHLNR